MKTLLLTSLSLLVSHLSITAGGLGWMHDFSAAKEKALKENKALLVDFTGSDWCGWCIRLNEEVFQQEAFKNGVNDKFVLVEIDYPQDESKLSQKTKEQNQQLQQTYQVEGFPTILLMDAQGRPFAQTGYQEGGAEKYVTHLNELLKSGQQIKNTFSEAKKLEGVTKAKHLIKALDLIPATQVNHYQDVADQVLSLDPEDQTGFAARIKVNEELIELEKTIDTLFDNNEASKAPAIIDEFIASHQLEKSLREQLHMMKLQIQMTISNLDGDIDEVLKHVDNFIITSKAEGVYKQEILSMKLGALINSKRFKEVELLADEIIAVSPASEIGELAAKFKAEDLPQIIKQAGNPAHGEDGHIHTEDE